MNKKTVDINTFYRNNRDDINILYKTIIMKLDDLNIYNKYIGHLDFNEFVNFVFAHSDNTRRSYYE